MPSAEIEQSPTDATGTVMLDIGCIHPYERNPRRHQNPEYDRIKDSIRAQGLDQPLVVTQRPDADHYIVHAGGNTRLLILQELYDETREARFASVACVFRPWRSESDVLLAHLRENDLRCNLTFIDKALALHQAKQLLRAELGMESASQRQLEAVLKAAGYRISHALSCQMAYAVERLLPLIPQALEAGMGKHQVVRIQTLERAARELWIRRCASDESAFEAVFTTLCRRYDGPAWDIEFLRGALETEIAEEAETSVQTIRVELDAALDGREVVIPPFVPIKAPPDSPQSGNDVTGATTPSRADADEASVPAAESVPNDSTSAVLADEAGQAGTDVVPTEPAPARLKDLKSLRGRAWTLAMRLAQRNGLGDLVAPLSGQGLGYILRDVPDPALADQLDQEALAPICGLWWQLAACAEMTCAPVEAIVPLLPEASVLRRALADEDAELLFSSIWTLDPGQTGYRVWRSLQKRDWEDLLNLMATYRQIHHLAAEQGAVLWG